MNKKCLIPNFLLLSLLLFPVLLVAQVQQGGQPYSFSHPSKVSKSVPVALMPSLDMEALAAEDAIDDLHKDIPWRFGSPIPVNLHLSNSGVWETVNKSDQLWRLSIKSDGAQTINLNFDFFYLPQGAKLFIYNQDRSHVLGAFTSFNNKEDFLFATTLIKGDQIILEYFEPAAVAGQGAISISEVIHGYRTFDYSKAFGSSGSCNINVVCPLGLGWEDQIRSSAMLLTAGGSRFCSGALINNTASDGTQYFLTANHCNPSTSTVFMFNYQSSLCTPSSDGITSQTAAGCIIRAKDSPSDFCLVEIVEAIPPSYNVYYSGWNRNDVAPNATMGIHHPRGDVKKIASDYHPAVSSGYGTMSGVTHWRVNDWDEGTTEPGSSGSPLYDPSKRIIGQLHGGSAACGNDLEDYYGKFSHSWASSTNIAKQLAHWLDPIGAGVTVLDGYDPNAPVLALDARAVSITGIDANLCQDDFTATFTFKNNGTTPLSTLAIYYHLDGDAPMLYEWSGTLASGAESSITFDEISVLAGGERTFTVYTAHPNGGIDENLANDTLQFVFNKIESAVLIDLIIQVDNYGSELTWELVQDDGTVVASGGPYDDVDGGELLNFTFCVENNHCFTFNAYDSYGDGICCDYGIGYFTLNYHESGESIFSITDFSSSSTSETFCLYDCPFTPTALITDAVNGLANGAISLTVTGGEAPYSFFWLDGGATDAERTALLPGFYTVQISDQTASCTASYTYEIKDLPCPSINIEGVVTDVSTPFSGAIETSVSGGQAPYTYAWSNGDNTATIDGLSAGEYTVTVTDANLCKAERTFSVKNNGALGLGDGFLQSLTYFPNPNQGQFYVSFDAQKYAITHVWVSDMLGKNVNTQIEKNSLDQYQITLENKAAGVYILHIVADGKTHAVKFSVR